MSHSVRADCRTRTDSIFNENGPNSDRKSLQKSQSVVPKRGRSKRGRTQKHANERQRAQMSAKEHKCKSANERKRAQKDAKEHIRAVPRKNCKQPGLKLRSGYGVHPPELEGENPYCHFPITRCLKETDHRQVYPDALWT